MKVVYVVLALAILFMIMGIACPRRGGTVVVRGGRRVVRPLYGRRPAVVIGRRPLYRRPVVRRTRIGFGGGYRSSGFRRSGGYRGGGRSFGK